MRIEQRRSSESRLAAHDPLWVGAREASGVPAAVLGAGYLGFGALASGSDFSVWQALVSTATIWALPGQILLIELHNVNAPALALIPAVMLTSARFLPMTAALMPILRDRDHRSSRLYLAAHLVAMTGWAAAMRRCPELPLERRLPYFVGFALVCWLTCLGCTLAGFFVADSFHPLIKLGFVFLTPVYFLLILTGDVRHRLGALALGCGAVAGPLLHLFTPEWSVLLGGLLGGSAAYFAYRFRVNRRV